MPFKKKIASAKRPTVTVQTKKMTDGECCMPKHHRCGKFFLVILLLVNIALTSLVAIRQSRIESMRVGGDDNYKMLQQVFQSEGFQAQQRQQIQQAMQLYQVPVTDDVAETPAQ